MRAVLHEHNFLPKLEQILLIYMQISVCAVLFSLV